MVNKIFKHKDGGLYKVVDIRSYRLSNLINTYLVEYTSIYDNKIYVRTLDHFHSSFKLADMDKEKV